jgi:hypothetical protein
MAGESDFLNMLQARCEDFGLRVSHGVEMPGGVRANLFASRTYFSWKGLIIISQRIVVCDFGDDYPTPEESEAIFDAGFKQAKRINRVPLLRGMQFGYMVVPCIVVETAYGDLIEYAESPPRKHWALFEFPVVVERSTRETYYFRQTAL